MVNYNKFPGKIIMLNYYLTLVSYRRHSLPSLGKKIVEYKFMISPAIYL